QLHLIEEDFLAGLGMSDDRRTYLTRAQIISICPLEIDFCPAAVVFDRRPVVGVKEVLPAHIQTIGKVAHVPQAFLLEAFPYSRLHQLINLPTIDDRRFASNCSCL